MKNLALVYPMFAMVMLTLVVLVSLFWTRTRFVREGKVKATHFKTYQEGVEPADSANLARHFASIFEAPTVFYVVCLAAMSTGLSSGIFVGLAWTYFQLRHAPCDVGLSRSDRSKMGAVASRRMASLVSAKDWRSCMPAADHRLTTVEVAQFVTDGYLRFDALVPEDLNRRVIAELGGLAQAKIPLALAMPPTEDSLDRPASGTPLSQCYAAPSTVGEILRLPSVQGVIRSLVGDDPLYDHDFVHLLPAGSTYTQHLHVDAIVDTPDPAFDIQLFYFPEDVVKGGGGTRFVPGSHLRRVRAADVSRYQHMLGERRFTGPAGTILIFHHGLWHAGQANPSAKPRWMYKIRLNPRGPQTKLWNTDDFATHHNDASDHRFATMRFDSVGQQLRKDQPWQQGHEARYELVARTRLWRYLSGDDRFDVDYYLTRLERHRTGSDGADTHGKPA